MQRRRVWIGVGLLAALAGAFGLWRDGDRRGEDAAGSPVSPIPGAEDPPLPPAGVVVPDQESSAPRVELPDDANDVLTPSPEGSALVQLVGQVVDVGGRPLAGVEAALTSSGAWRQAADPPLPDRYVEQADADGRFRFEVSQPDAKRVRLVLTPDENHRIARRTFGEGHDEPPLAEGPHDLGQIVLGPAGRIEGTIRTVAGQPLVGASASLSVRGGWILRGKADEQGRYVIARVPPGSYRVEAIKNAFLHASRRGVVVNPGEMTFDVDFELSPSPSIAGRVVGRRGGRPRGRSIDSLASLPRFQRARSFCCGRFLSAGSAPGRALHAGGHARRLCEVRAGTLGVAQAGNRGHRDRPASQRGQRLFSARPERNYGRAFRDPVVSGPHGRRQSDVRR